MPYTLPNGWCWCKLGDLCSFESGFAFSSNDFKTSGIPLVRISNIQDSAVTLKNCVFIQDEVDEKYIIKTGDLLIAMSGATTGKMGIYSMRQRALLNQRVGNICVQSRYLTANYRNYFMYSQSDVILKMAYGGAQPNISSQMILNIPIPLPPLSEQYRIVNAIKNLLEIVDRIEENQISLDKFLCSIKQKILQLALSGNLLTQDHNDEPAIDLLRRINPSYIPCDNRHYRQLPDSWETCQLKDIFDITMGQSPAGDTINGKYGTEFHQGKINFTNKYLAESAQYTTTPSKIAAPESLLLCVRAPVGIVNITKREICIGRGLCSLRPKYDIDSLYWLYMLSTLKDYFEENATGSTFKAISGDIIRNASIPFPPLSEQRRILSKINELFCLLDKITAEL